MSNAVERRSRDEQPLVFKSIPFVLVHLAPIGLWWTGFHLREAVLCFALYYGRMFFITAGFHRYFAHRAYKMGRVMQFLMAWGGSSACQKGVLWWAAHHRSHHRHSDTERDIHSPKRGFWWSHVGWILCPRYQATDWPMIKDFSRYPELVWLNRYHLVPGVALGTACYLLGGWSALWTFFLSTTLLYHGTFSINSLMHLWGRRRYATTDTSKNSFLLALVTMGEGWHNNHHYYQSTANQGFFWWEVDPSYYLLCALEKLRLVRDLRSPPAHVLLRNRVDAPSAAPRHMDTQAQKQPSSELALPTSGS
jgi:stearoyl-CoA desaturase (Delta-9 desaturase)